MALNQYLTDVQLLCHDTGGVFASQANYTNWINEARSWVAGEGMCVRQLAIVPLVVSQETYSLPSPTNAVALGMGQALGCLNISVAWGAVGSIKPTLDRYPWSEFQARFRSYGGTQVGNPAIWAQMGDASGASIYLFPIPQQTYNSEWDIYCNVLPLTSDTSPEAIPFPFTSAVKYYAAHLAMLNAQKDDQADKMLQRYKMKLAAARSMVSRAFIPSAYNSR
jgi:hypothetical protein